MEYAILILVCIGLSVGLFFTLKGLFAKNKENKRLKEDFKPIIDLEKEIKNKTDELERLKKEAHELSDKFVSAKEILSNLESEIKIYQDDLELLDFGVYKPHFDFDTSEKYKNALLENKERQKELIKSEIAAVCNTNWTVGNSQKQGEMMTKRAIKLTLRAFNGECDSLITKVKWNNAEQSEQRILKAFDAINKLNKSNDINITQEYLDLKIEELRISHELEEKKYEEKEEQRQIREQMREEEKAQRELEKAQKDAEAEEKRYEKALAQAQKELEKAQGDELEKLNAKILKLQDDLKTAQESKERAISRAQLTKSGHVYVISNIGSFGNNVYKIGMTRRLEPLDRVKELGDASVPFQFDVHAMIYSENAPELENALHKEFGEKRVNMINNRKEYFNVSLNEIEIATKKISDAEIEFTQKAEAQEYRESLALLKKLNNEMNEIGKEKVADKYPATLF
ncbi:DUF4041 domain-containing protein [Marinigracilibium pacificum]|uniref:DUF4041 domain-containing protein n=1 Tax=Marinigracilibium pacificum TaxID=2729599 RepID=A0A848J309_9BACT|nr:DUF4041 domain-containing protein [Marinigracilibium pacificum]NMM48920.1 DUF4041 domain-containing protein [Marinigracilibium pacificum]